MALARPSGETLVERVGLALNLGPAPVVEAMFAPIQARVLHAAVRTGVLRRLPAREAELVQDLGLRPEPARLLLDCLAAAGHVERRRDGRWALTRRSARWLDPASATSIHGYIEHTAEYWDWWARLEDVLRGGEPVEIHDPPPGDPAWRRYITGQYELARLSAPEVARAVRVPAGARSVLDLAGGHGLFAAELCRRHDGMEATVLDLPGSAAVGRELMAAEGMAERVSHVEGDLATADLGGPHDVVLAFNIVHHLSEPEVRALLGRIHAAMRPGGTVAVLDLFTSDRAGQGALLGLFFHLTSGARTYAPAELSAWLADAGFSGCRGRRMRRVRAQTLYQATRRP